MEHGAGINRFAILLFCLLVPLGSSAPTEMKSKTTTGQRQKQFPTDIKTLTPLIEKRATTLFECYKNCILPTLQDDTWLLVRSRERDIVEKIPECPAFRANCCALHHIYNILKILRSDIESMCGPDSHNQVNTSLTQLESTLSEGTGFYTCRSEELPQGFPSQGQTLSWAEKKTYIWWVLEKYERIMKTTKQLVSQGAV